MSGQEASARQFDPVHASAADIQQFIETGYAGADKLVGSGLWYTNRDEGRSYEGSPYGILRSKTGEDLSSVWGAFNDWMAKRKQTVDDHDTYLKLKADNPGRDATIVGFNQEKQGTVLGDKLPYSKTVLG